MASQGLAYSPVARLAQKVAGTQLAALLRSCLLVDATLETDSHKHSKRNSGVPRRVWDEVIINS